MNKPHLPLLLIAACFAFGCISIGGSTSFHCDQWRPIEGAKLAGWVQHGGMASFVEENGIITGETRPNQPNSFLCSIKEYGDFELHYEFRVDDALNSGVQIRSHVKPENDVVYGYQIEIDPSPRAYTCGIYEESGRGWLKDLKDNPDAQKAFKHGEWNHVRVIAQRDHIQTWLNGVLAANLFDNASAKGFIALQVHGVGDRKDPLKIQWRNIRIQELPPYFDKFNRPDSIPEKDFK